jgi:DNA-binding NtrC family response regulator
LRFVRNAERRRSVHEAPAAAAQERFFRPDPYVPARGVPEGTPRPFGAGSRIESRLERCGGNLSEAARAAGLSRSNLYAKLEELGLR